MRLAKGKTRCLDPARAEWTTTQNRGKTGLHFAHTVDLYGFGTSVATAYAPNWRHLRAREVGYFWDIGIVAAINSPVWATGLFHFLVLAWKQTHLEDQSRSPSDRSLTRRQGSHLHRQDSRDRTGFGRWNTPGRGNTLLSRRASRGHGTWLSFLVEGSLREQRK